jgi:hypothetical protein
MTHFLKTEDKPDGYRLEDILGMIRNDVLYRSTKIMEDERPEARHVLDNNIQILTLLAKAMALAEDSTRVLTKAFGPAKAGEPRIGVK